MLEILQHTTMYMGAVIAVLGLIALFAFLAIAVVSDIRKVAEEIVESYRTIKFFNKIEEYRRDFA